MITRQTVIFLGLSQLICWGISYYLIAAFGIFIAEDLGWSGAVVYGGFSASLVVMGLTSALTGRLIDRYGGSITMAAGSGLLAAGCLAIAFSYSVFWYYCAWLILGFAMRLTLYDAAFASLVRISGIGAKLAISKITLLGGLASSVFWPIGFFLAENYGWRAGLIIYAAFALSTIPLHLAIPKTRFKEQLAGEADLHQPFSQLRLSNSDLKRAGALYALIFMLLNFLSSAMSTHMISILAGLGLGAALSVWASTLRGIGQSVARVCEVLFGKRLHPMTLSVLAASLLPFGFAAGFFSGQFVAAAFTFTFLFGAGNGLMTISRGTLPLVLFDSRSYGSYVGKLLMPSFLLSAAAPLVFTYIIGNFGEWAALGLSAGIAFIILAASLSLKMKYGAM